MLSYVEGLRASGASSSEAEAQALLDHLAGNSFVRAREGRERLQSTTDGMGAFGSSPAEIRAAQSSRIDDRSPCCESRDFEGRALGTGSQARHPREKTLKALIDALAQASTGVGG